MRLNTRRVTPSYVQEGDPALVAPFGALLDRLHRAITEALRWTPASPPMPYPCSARSTPAAPRARPARAWPWKGRPPRPTRPA